MKQTLKNKQLNENRNEKQSTKKKRIGTKEVGIDNRRNGVKHEVSELRKTSG